jgi:PAS domain S-box-containing protein
MKSESDSTIDSLWRGAPAPALRLRSVAAGLRIEPNAAAQAWAATQRLQPTDFEPLARSAWVLEGSGEAEGDTTMVLLGPVRVRCRRVALADGALLWLLPDAPAPYAGGSDGQGLVDARRRTEFLDRALLLAGISVWRLDLRSRRIHFNAVGFASTGLVEDPQGVPVDQIRESIHPDDREAVVRAAEAAIRSDRVVDVVARYSNADGSWRTLLTRRVADRDELGRAVGLAGVSLDLTAQMAERERAEALVERSRLVAEGIGVGFWSRDVETGVLEWDEQMFRIHRRDPALGAPRFADWMQACVHPRDRAWVADQMRGVEGRWDPATDMLFRAVHDDEQGGERWIQSWGRRLRRGDRRLSFGMHLDVTVTRRQHAAAALERERTQFAIQAAEVGVWERDREGRLTYLNDVMYRQRGLDPSDPRPVEEVARASTHPDDLVRLQEGVRRHLATGEPYRMELRVRRPDGSWRWLTTQGQALRDADGRVLGMAGVQIDVTERKRADTLQREKQRIEQASRDKSMFMARMSHELRTPMNAVLGFTRLLEDDALEPPSPRQRERLARIAAAGDRLLALVDNVLDLAQLEVEADPPPAMPVTLAEVLREACAAVAGDAERRGVQLRLPERTSGSAFGDRRRLVQAVGHVLLQVLQRCLPGTVVTLRAGAEGMAPAPLRALIGIGDPAPASAGQGSLFELAEGSGADEPDTGPDSGFDTNFDPLHPSGFDPDIGLSLALRLVQALGGHIETLLEGAPLPAALGGGRAGGRVHVLELPAAAELTLALPPAVQPRATGGALHVLCVEDNPVNLQLVREVFALRPQVRLRTAIDGASGLAAAVAEPPDLVLLDLQLPDINGIEVLRRLRAEASLDSCTIIALSADAMPEHISHARAAGFDDYWTKPIHFDRFLADIDRLAALRAAAAPG